LSWYRGSTRRRDRADITDEAARNCVVDHSPCDGVVTAATVWCSERSEGAVGSAAGGLQVEGEGECLGFARGNVSCEVEGLRECAGIRIEDALVFEQLEPLCGESDRYDAKMRAQLLPDAGYT
jgi:hypothetical protein